MNGAVPAHRLGWLDVGMELQVDLFEAGLLCELDQVALVEVEHWAARYRLQAVVHCPHFTRQFDNRGRIVCPEHVRRARIAEAVDRLEKRDAATRLEDAVKLLEGTL